MPHFVWVLRDFSLRLVDERGVQMTPDAYMESALQTSDPSKDEIRSVIRLAFPTRRLFTFPRPTTDDASITYLESRLGRVAQKFTHAVDRLREYLYRVPPITSHGSHAIPSR